MNKGWLEIGLSLAAAALIFSAPFLTAPWPGNFFQFLHWIIACFGLAVFIAASGIMGAGVLLTPLPSNTPRVTQNDYDLMKQRTFGHLMALTRISAAALLLFLYWYGNWRSSGVLWGLSAALSMELITAAYASMWIGNFRKHYIVD